MEKHRKTRQKGFYSKNRNRCTAEFLEEKHAKNALKGPGKKTEKKYKDK